MDAPRPTTGASALPPHLPALDGLRGLAILLVLVHQLNLLESPPDVIALVYSRFSYIGWTGVQLFFVLSGFLITGILLDSQRAKNYYSAFYARRTLRIFPLYFGVLAVAFLVLPAIGAVPAKIAQDQPNQIWLWLYLSNWAAIFDVGSKAFGHFWSLAVEEQFYLVWPLLIRSKNPTQCLRFCLAVSIAGFGIRCILAAGGTVQESIYINSFCRMDALALGGAAAAAFRIPCWRERLILQHRRLFLWSFITGAMGLAVTRGFWNGTLTGETIGYTFVSLMFVLLLIAAAGAELAANSRWITLLKWPPLCAIGKYSYAMYIFHKPLHDLVGKPFVVALEPGITTSTLLNLGYTAAGIAVIFAAAFVSWHLFEKHFIQLKRYFVPKEL